MRVVWTPLGEKKRATQALPKLTKAPYYLPWIPLRSRDRPTLGRSLLGHTFPSLIPTIPSRFTQPGFRPRLRTTMGL